MQPRAPRQCHCVCLLRRHGSKAPVSTTGVVAVMAIAFTVALAEGEGVTVCSAVRTTCHCLTHPGPRGLYSVMPPLRWVRRGYVRCLQRVSSGLAPPNEGQRGGSVRLPLGLKGRSHAWYPPGALPKAPKAPCVPSAQRRRGQRGSRRRCPGLRIRPPPLCLHRLASVRQQCACPPPPRPMVCS